MDEQDQRMSERSETHLIDAAELARATRLLQAGQIKQAEAACRALLLKTPRAAPAVHLLGLIRKDAGDAREGERLLRESIALQPDEPEFKSNLAHLLRRTGRPEQAETLYRQVLQSRPQHRQTRIGLIRTLSDLGRQSAAEIECRALLSSNERDSQAWSLLAMTLREQNRLPEAEQAYQRAIEITPEQPLAHHNLGSVLVRMDRAEEALAALERAEARGLRGFELAFNRGMALLQLYRIDEAERAFVQAVEANPLHGEAQVNLARLRFMRGDPNFSRDMARAAAAHPHDANLQTLFALILRRVGDLPRAEALLRRLMTGVGPKPEVRAALSEILLEGGRLEEAETEAIEAVAALPDNANAVDTLVTILLARGRPDDALPFVHRQRQQRPLSQGWIAHEATALRMLDAAAYRELYDFDRFIRVYDLEAPAGWSSMEEFNAHLLGALAARHAFATHPLDQSLRNGTQTTRNLLKDADPTIQAVLKLFEAPIHDYQRRVGAEASHPLCARNRSPASIAAAWSVQLHREGFHVNHVHPEGWLSSAYYVSVPAEVRDQDLMSGWIKFGESRYPAPGVGPEAVIQPRAGRLVLFPSYMWHGTNPIHGSEARTTIAFDAIPKKK
ncbi:MAG TPA: tetratricopeptide repeat protein [Steroidobacter sp.]|jgi:Flp pilus assembly protein TadD|nr:tetratricopeptide repeat protein [Steroidobacter sp.]